MATMLVGIMETYIWLCSKKVTNMQIGCNRTPGVRSELRSSTVLCCIFTQFSAAVIHTHACMYLNYMLPATLRTNKDLGLIHVSSVKCNSFFLEV